MAAHLRTEHAHHSVAPRDLVRRVCLALPEVRETTTFANPTLQAGKNTFAVLDSYQGRRCTAFKSDPPAQQRLCKQDAYALSPFGAKQSWTLA